MIVDVNPFEWASWTPFLFAIVLFGFLPGIMLGVTETSLHFMGLGAG